MILHSLVKLIHHDKEKDLYHRSNGKALYYISKNGLLRLHQVVRFLFF